ncbi:uncharacterized protein LOC130904068 [Diorhabda carinulata]|uniref:uncharacterized protein LOC130904068 n=1 Tax=Diorhabda carinulata TaxID=1163345 RepID=UPI0025A27EC1|nr:uncharacterized protein LOC130904068 [Diorhabda carinulata]
MIFPAVLLLAATLVLSPSSLDCQKSEEFPGLAGKLSTSLKYLVANLPQKYIYEQIKKIKDVCNQEIDCQDVAALTEPISLSLSKLVVLRPITFKEILSLAIEFDVVILQFVLCPLSESMEPSHYKEILYALMPNHGTNLTTYTIDFHEEKCILKDIQDNEIDCNPIYDEDQSPFSIIKKILSQDNLAAIDITYLLINFCLHLVKTVICSL